MKKTFLLSIVLILAVALLCGCGGSSDVTTDGGATTAEFTDKDIEESILGAWEYEDDNSRMVYIFQEGGTGYAALFPMTYTIDDGVITVTVSAFGKTESGSAKYSVDGDSLSLEQDGETHVLTRTEIPEEYKSKLGL